MANQKVSEAEIIQMTLENVRSFYNREKSVTTAPMTDNFMWIGSNDFQWCEGLGEFNRVTEKEYNEPAVLLSDEEYYLLFHERNVWVVYGKYKDTAVIEGGRCFTPMRGERMLLGHFDYTVTRGCFTPMRGECMCGDAWTA